jgi:serine protease AprX
MARRLFALIAGILLSLPAYAAAQGTLDAALAERALTPTGESRVIVRTTDGRRADAAIRAVGGRAGRFLRGLGAQVAFVPDSALETLAARPGVAHVALDRTVTGTVVSADSAVSTGAATVRRAFGVDGTGVGVAIIDSGVVNWHDDLGDRTVVHFVDFVNELLLPYDDFGHGTHVAGIIAGNGYDSNGARRGVAPGAHLVVLKVLDDTGNGHISNVIAAIDYAIENRARFNIRIINLSVAAGVHESFLTDPLTLAARRAVDAGIVVITAAGNLGRSAKGVIQPGSITSPGNAPWVLTVGASNDQGTAKRSDDTLAPFTSRGPTHIDGFMKPDLVAPGVGIESLADPNSTLYAIHPEARLPGTVQTATMPYLRLTGTSMAAPVVTGTVALMLEANPDLTPNLVKAILQYTAERRRYDTTAQGAGFLNTRGAVQLALLMAGKSIPASAADQTRWSRRLVWGNTIVRGGVLTPDANAWSPGIVWGQSTTPSGDHITFGIVPESDQPWTLQPPSAAAEREY